MAKNWFIEANKSKDPEVKDLLKQYNTLDANSADYETQKATIVAAIKTALESPAENVQPDTETGPENVQPESDIDSIDAELDSQDEPENPENSESAENAQSDNSADLNEPEVIKDEPEQVSTFQYTEADAAKAKTVDDIILMKKICREEIVRLEKTRLKHGTYKQNRELDSKIWNVRRIIGIALKRELALKERERRIRNAGRVSSIALKRARFVKLIRQGISITNITKHPSGVKKEELIEVLDKDTIEACKKDNSRFPDMWLRWKEKFIDKKDNNK